MLKKRIIPCLDIKDGRTVKGINFSGLRDAGDPLVLAKKYELEGADELVFLDITASLDNRNTLVNLVKEIAKELAIPFTVGGGIKSVNDAYRLLEAGADKVSINSAALNNPGLINELANHFGNQCIVAAIDSQLNEHKDWYVHGYGGTHKTQWKLLDWVKEVTYRGAGEILMTSMQHDGTQQGFAIDMLTQITAYTSLPIIASGGAGNKDHFLELFQKTSATGALAATLFHYGQLSIPELKTYLKNNQISIR